MPAGEHIYCILLNDFGMCVKGGMHAVYFAECVLGACTGGDSVKCFGVNVGV